MHPGEATDKRANSGHNLKASRYPVDTTLANPVRWGLALLRLPFGTVNAMPYPTQSSPTRLARLAGLLQTRLAAWLSRAIQTRLAMLALPFWPSHGPANRLPCPTPATGGTHAKIGIRYAR